MKFKYPITPETIQDNENVLFVYGKCALGLFLLEGTCEYTCQMAHSTNTLGIPVKKSFCPHRDKYAQDHEFHELWLPTWETALDMTRRYHTCVYFPKIGAGGARLPEVAPATYRQLLLILNDYGVDPIQYEH